MTIRQIIAASLLAITMPLTAPLSAQGTEVQANPHERVYDAINSGVDRSALDDALVASVKRSFAQEAIFQTLEQQSPGLVEEIGDAIRPVLLEYSERVRLEYRPRMVALLRSNLSAEEAVQVVDFYESPIGQRLMLGVSTNYRADAVLDNVTNGDTVTADQVQEDTRATTAATLAELSEEERAELVRTALQNPAFGKMRQIGPQLAVLRAEMEEAPMTPAEQQRLEAVMQTVLKKRFPNM